MSLVDLPNELLQEIAKNCDSHNDLIAYMQTCRATRAAVAHERSGIWRHRYTKMFDCPNDRCSKDISKDYLLLYTRFHRVCLSTRSSYAVEEFSHPQKVLHLIKGTLHDLFLKRAPRGY